jgi:hypothetical protein
MSLLDNASIVWPLGAQTKAGNLAAWNPQTKSTVPFDVVRATIKQRINEAGAWEEVAANVLARDFTNGGCGDFTIEPARKFLFLNSITGVTQDITVVSGRNYAVSFSGTGSITFSVGATGTLTGSGATALDRVSSIVTTTGTSVTCTISGTVQYVNIEINTNDSSVTYSTSWMKTLDSIVTRNEDVPSLTGASALLNDSEGFIYAEFKPFISDGQGISFVLSDGTSGNRVFLGKNIAGTGYVSVVSSGGSNTVVLSGGTISSTSFNKALMSYGSGAALLSTNGATIQTGSGAMPTGLVNVNISDASPATTRFNGRLRVFIVGNQQPTESQANALTTP